MFLQMLIKQQMKLLNLTFADIAVKTGIPYNTVRNYVDSMNDYEMFVKLERIMTAVDLFTFDNKAVDKAIKRKLKKIDKNQFIC